jgi:O-antigen/teichoic acid export membrane protein
VRLLQKARAIWQEDNLLRRVVKNSSLLSSSNLIAAGLSFIQGILAARLLGANGLGVVTTIIAFATSINNLLSFRMSEVLVRHFNTAIVEGKKDQASAIAKGAGLTEAATSITAFLVLLLLTPWAARTFAKDASSTSLFAFYGLTILSNIIYETSRGILQAQRRFGQFASIYLAQTSLTFLLILGAFLTNTTSLAFILAAYMAGKTLAGIGIVILAVRTLNETLPGWQRVPLRTYRGWRGLLGFALNTNLNGTVTLFVRDNIPLYIAALIGATEVGYFKIALGFTTLLMLPVEPFIWPTYTEITRTIALKQFEITRRLLRRVSLLAGGWVFAAGGVIAALGWWLIPLLYTAEFAPSYPAVLILLIGYGFANIFGWNRPLLLALGRPTFPLVSAAVTGAVELMLIFTMVSRYGYLSAAAILSGFLVISIGINIWRGMREINLQSAIYLDQAVEGSGE